MRRVVTALVLCFAVKLPAAGVVPIQAPVGKMVEGVACASDPTQTYTLYLPRGFDADTRWPVLLIFDPRGRSVHAAELFREAADTYGWILVSSDNTRSDGPMEPNVVALRALWPEVHTRLPARFDRIYTAGFSGGVAVALVLSRSTHEVAGIIASGGRFLPDELKGNDVPIFSSAGVTDFNYDDMLQVDEYLANQGNAHRLVFFDGPHTWMPSWLATEAVAWFELLAMKNGLRPVDPEIPAALYRDDLAAAAALEGEDDLVAAARYYREMVAVYDGLHDTTTCREALARLEKNPDLRRQTKDHKRWNAWEADYLRQKNRDLYELRHAEIPPPVAQLARSFRIDELKQRALEPGYEGLAAQRALNSLATGLTFYLPRDFTAAGQYDRLAVSLELGMRVRGDNPVGWYNLACARARLGREEAAVEALQRALELGFDNDELLATDADLDPLRDRKDFRALMAAR